MNAKLVLEDGTIFKGNSFGSEIEGAGEVVFNTSMMGYQEILTDPSYKGQIVCMTPVLIGNYGINEEDFESERIHVEGFVVKEASKIASNWRSRGELCDFLQKNNIAGIENIDTRALTRLIRDKGSLRGLIANATEDDKKLIEKAKNLPDMQGRNLADSVSINEITPWNDNGEYNVVVIDCGVKTNILKELALSGCKLTLVPSKTSFEQIMELKPDGVMLSNGPGDPEPVKNVIGVVKKLLEIKMPIFGICLGNQILGIALGGTTYKLKFGHHGANHPVKDLKTGKIAISVQNHNFCVDLESLPKEDIEVTHINLNDQTVEGIRHKVLPAFAVQFHPEANPGPNDTKYIFKNFVEMMECQKEKI